MRWFGLVLMVLFFQLGNAQNSYYPKPIGFVNDYEGIFNKTEVQQLDNGIKDLLSKAIEREALKGMELAVVTVTDSMFGGTKDIGEYAMQLGARWKMGEHGDNNAVVIAVCRHLRKVTIVTGTGLEQLLPNETCQRIVDERMAPELRKGQYYNGVLAALAGLKEFLGLK